MPQTPYGESDEAKPNGAKLYSKPVIVLTSARTYSAAEDFTMTFIGMKRGAVMGEPTGGSTGQPLVFKLPGGGFGYVVTKRDTFPDGKEFVGIGIQPDIIVRPRIDDFLAGRDNLLIAAIEQARKAKVSHAK
jgi:C-terminal processing protease CtpA/Prc